METHKKIKTSFSIFSPLSITPRRQASPAFRRPRPPPERPSPGHAPPSDDGGDSKPRLHGGTGHLLAHGADGGAGRGRDLLLRRRRGLLGEGARDRLPRPKCTEGIAGKVGLRKNEEKSVPISQIYFGKEEEKTNAKVIFYSLKTFWRSTKIIQNLQPFHNLHNFIITELYFRKSPTRISMRNFFACHKRDLIYCL